MSNNKLKRKRSSRDVEESVASKKRKSVSFEAVCGKEGEDNNSLEEHSQLLGQVTGQVQRLPLEDSSEVNGVHSSKKKRRRKRSVGGSEQDKTEDVVNCESSIDKTSAAQYLVQWDSDRDNWSFKKKTQYWLLQNMYFKPSVSRSNFTIMLRYLEGLQGNQRKIVLKKASDLIKENEPIKDEVTDVKWIYKRAVKVAQVLSN